MIGWHSALKNWEKNNAINKRLQLDNIINYHKVKYNNHILKKYNKHLGLDPPQSFTNYFFDGQNSFMT